jgi:hypothetical protein
MQKVTKWQARKLAKLAGPQTRQDKIEDYQARQKQKHNLALQASNKQLQAIEKHCFNQTLTTNYKGIEMKDLQSWKTRRQIRKANNEIDLLKSLASDNMQDREFLADKIIEKAITITKKVNKANEKLESYEKQTVSRELRNIAKPVIDCNHVTSNENATEKEKRDADNRKNDKLDIIFNRLVYGK